MELFNLLIEKLELLIRKDNEKVRGEIARICSRFLNEEFESYKRLKGEIQDVIDELNTMDQIGDREGYYEPYILHVDLGEVKLILTKLKKLIETNPNIFF